MLLILAAEFMTWSMATNEKLKVMNSQIGRSPFIAAPTAIPAKPSSAMGVSITLFSPNSANMPWLTLYAPLYSATSSPIKKMLSSLRISSCMASRRASLKAISLMISNEFDCKITSFRRNLIGILYFHFEFQSILLHS